MHHPNLWLNIHMAFSVCEFSSVAQLCLNLCDPMGCSRLGSPVLHCLLEFAQTHVHWVSDAIQPSHPVVPFTSCLQPFIASRSFPMSQFFASGGQSFGVSPSASVLPMNIQEWFPLGLTGWISLQSKGLSRVLSSPTIQKHQFFGTQFSLLMVQFSHPYMTTVIVLTMWTFVSKAMSLLFNRLSRFVIVFLPRSKHLLISWLQSPLAVILEPKKIVSHRFHRFPIYLP